MKVLVVDDELANRRLLRAQLESEGFAVCEAADGVEALTVLEREPVDAVVSDILMPELDGYGLCAQVRQAPRWRNLPIILYSASYGRSADVQIALDAGADRFVSRPASAPEIAATLRQLIAGTPRSARPPVTADGELIVMRKYNAQMVARLEAQNVELGGQARWLQLFMEHAPAMIAMFDREMRYLACSRRWISDLHITDPDIIGRSHYELFPDLPERWKDVHRRCLAGAVESCELDAYPRSDGTVDWLKWEVHPWRTRRDEVGGLIMMGEIITERVRTETARRESERQYRALIDNLPGAVYRCRNDADYAAEYVSPAIERLTGYPAEAILRGAMTLGGTIHPDDRERVWRGVQDGLATSGRYALEFRIRRADGEIRWFADHGSAVYGDDGAVKAMEGLVLDITERKRAEAAAEESRLRLEAIVRAANVGLWEWDIVTNRVYYSPEWKRQLGYADGEIADDFTEWQSRVHPDDLPSALDNIGRYLAEPGPLYRNETRMRHKDGSWRWILVAATIARGADGKPRRMLGAHLDITDRKRTEEALRDAADRMQALARRLVELQETAQRRMSAELHDRIGQNLTALALNLELVGAELPPETARQLQPRLRDSRNLLEQTVRSVRALITDLRPVVLEDYGLLAGLRAFGREYEARTGIATVVSGDEPVPRLAPSAELALYRIAQEAMTNTVKYARAHHVEVRLAGAGPRAELVIADDGTGFDPASPGPGPHWGLELMRERAEAVGGHLEVTSAPGRGTRVRAEVPRAP